MTNVAERRPSLDGAPARSEAEGIWPAHLVICLSAYNEEGKVGPVVREFKGLNGGRIPIVVVDDGSTDRTAEEAREAGADRVIRLEKNGGQYVGLRAAFREALAMGAQVIAFSDADGQYDGTELPRLLAAYPDADMVIGSRFMTEGRGRGLKLYRRGGIVLFTWLFNRVFHESLTDAFSGFTVIRASLIADMLPHLRIPQYGRLEMLAEAHRWNARLVEIPIRAIRVQRSTKGSAKFGIQVGVKLLRETLKGAELRPGALPPRGKTYPATTPRPGEAPVGALGNS